MHFFFFSFLFFYFSWPFLLTLLDLLITSVDNEVKNNRIVYVKTLLAKVNLGGVEDMAQIDFDTICLFLILRSIYYTKHIR